MPNMKNETYRELKQIIQDSHNTQAKKSALLQQIHDVYHFGQSELLKMAIKHPKVFMEQRRMHRG